MVAISIGGRTRRNAKAMIDGATGARGGGRVPRSGGRAPKSGLFATGRFRLRASPRLFRQVGSASKCAVGYGRVDGTSRLAGDALNFSTAKDSSDHARTH